MKILKWIGIILGSLVVIITAIVFFQIRKAENLMARTVDIKPVTMTIPEDSAALAIGKKWVTTLCNDCHNTDLGGKVFIDDPTLGKIFTPNITKGEGGIAYYSDLNWLGALRHGIAPTGRTLMIMPAHEFTFMRKEDIGGIIAYMKTVTPVDRVNGQTEFSAFAKILLSAGAFGESMFPYDVIDHQAEIPENTIDQSPVDRGAYLSLVIGCQSCHGAALTGSTPPDPNSPPAPNLTPAGNLANWSYDDFSNFIHSGKTKEGKTLDTKFMPWQAYSHLPEEELEAVFSYLKSLDALETTP